MNATAGAKTLADLLKPYRTDAIVDACGVHKDTVNRWRTGRSFPEVDKVIPLAAFLKETVETVVAAIAAQRAAA